MPPVPDSARDPKTPSDVLISMEPHAPYPDPRMGVDRPPKTGPGLPMNRLVTIGDSLTQGFQSGAIYNTHLSWPAIVASEMGWKDYRYPTYEGVGGLPFNIEMVVREMEHRFGDRIAWYELALAGFHLRSLMDDMEDYWERGKGSEPPLLTKTPHNLAVYGWDLRDALSWTAQALESSIHAPKDDVFSQVIENANERAALRVYPRMGLGDPSLTLFQAAEALGGEGVRLPDGTIDSAGDGIETLCVFLGANNALPTIVHLDVTWSGAGYDDLEQKKAYRVWRPTHFRAEYAQVVAAIRRIRARHVIVANVPHVTIAPAARGVARKVREDSRYFPYYTRPWISDGDFDAREDPHITEQQARAIDCAIDQYNEVIAASVRQARLDGLDWYLFDVATVLDRMAQRRYIETPAARPAWWRPYPLPPAVEALRPKPDTRFFASGPGGRTEGGLFSLDGVHPTTIGYGILAQEVIRLMELAGVTFFAGDGVTPRASPVNVDFERVIRRDSLISDPPRSVDSDKRLIGWLDEVGDFFARMLP